MAELKLGTKFECFRCGTKFYDMGKSNPLCPKCGADQREAGTHETFAATQAARRKRKAEVVRAVPVEEEEAVVEVEPIDEELAGAELAVDEVEGEEEVEDAE